MMSLAQRRGLYGLVVCHRCGRSRLACVRPVVTLAKVKVRVCERVEARRGEEARRCRKGQDEASKRSRSLKSVGQTKDVGSTIAGERRKCDASAGTETWCVIQMRRNWSLDAL